MTEMLLQVDSRGSGAFGRLITLRPLFNQWLPPDEKDELDLTVADLAVQLIQGTQAWKSPYRSKITPQQELAYAILRCQYELGAETTEKLLDVETRFFQEPIVKEILCSL